MCKVKTPSMAALPPPRATAMAPQRSGAGATASARVTSQYGGRNQIPQFAMPFVTAKLGGQTTVLGS